MPQFDVTTFATQVFWLIVCFSILCIMMKFIVVPRLTTALEERERRCQEDWEQSKDLNSSQEQMREESLARLSEARAKAHSKMHEVLHEIHLKKEERMALVDEELSLKTKKVRIDLDKQANKILDHMEPIVSQVIKSTSRRILGQPLTQTEIKKVVSGIFKESGRI